jgi:broad specificity phosphatase PhoE
MKKEHGTILFIRHAQTPANIAGVQVGYTRETDKLTEGGILACEKLALSLKERYVSIFGSRPLYLHRSDTHRTRETMEHVTRDFPGNLMVMTESPSLREIHMGNMIWSHEKSALKHTLKDHRVQIPWWESRHEVWQRMMWYTGSLDPSVDHIIFSHGIAISSLLQELTQTWNQTYPRIKNLDTIEIDMLRKTYSIHSLE